MIAYYAVPDPQGPAVMTYWRRNTKGELPIVYISSTRSRNSRLSRKFESQSRCCSQANQVFSRSGVWTFGLFQTTVYDAVCWQPFAEHICCSGSPA